MGREGAGALTVRMHPVYGMLTKCICLPQILKQTRNQSPKLFPAGLRNVCIQAAGRGSQEAEGWVLLPRLAAHSFRVFPRSQLAKSISGLSCLAAQWMA